MTVFDKYSLLIEAIDICFKDMLYFFTLLIIYILMFAAMDYVSETYEYTDRYFFYNFGERYRSIFGESLMKGYDFDDGGLRGSYYYLENGEGVMSWISYVIFTIVVHVVMLNLLIHLINESYQQIKSS